MNLMNQLTRINLFRSPADGGNPGGTPPASDPPASDPPASDPPSNELPAGFDIEKAPKDFTNEDGTYNFEGMFAKYDEYASADAIAAESRAKVPEKPEGYNEHFLIPDDIDFGELELPDGFKVELDLESPVYKDVFAKAGTLLHKHGLPPEAAQDFVNIFAQMKASEYSSQFTALNADLNTMGNVDARIANVERIIDSRLPEKEAAALKLATTSADGIRALEKLLATRRMGAGDPTPPKKDPSTDLDDYYSKPTR